MSVGSAGHETLKRFDQKKATLAQTRDMEFIVKYIRDSVKVNFSKSLFCAFNLAALFINRP